MPTVKRPIELSAEERAVLSALVEQKGIAGACRETGFSRTFLLGMIATGLATRPGAALVREYMRGHLVAPEATGGAGTLAQLNRVGGRF